MLKKMMGVWAIEHRDMQLTDNALGVLVAKFTADLAEEGVAPDEFRAACRKACRRWEHFPKMANILQAVDEYRASPWYQQRWGAPQIEESTRRRGGGQTREECQADMARIRVITSMLSGELRMDEAVGMVDRIKPSSFSGEMKV